MQRSISLLFFRSGACAMENLQISHKETAIPTFLAGRIVIECIRKIMRLPQSCNFAQTQAAPLVPPTQGAVSEADWGLYRQAVLSFKRSNCKLAAPGLALGLCPALRLCKGKCLPNCCGRLTPPQAALPCRPPGRPAGVQPLCRGHERVHSSRTEGTRPFLLFAAYNLRIHK